MRAPHFREYTQGRGQPPAKGVTAPHPRFGTKNASAVVGGCRRRNNRRTAEGLFVRGRVRSASCRPLARVCTRSTALRESTRQRPRPVRKPAANERLPCITAPGARQQKTGGNGG